MSARPRIPSRRTPAAAGRARVDLRSDPDPAGTTAGATRTVLPIEDIDAIRAPADPAAAGYQLAKRITGLPDGLVALIGGDQITDTAILGCLVPEPVRPILRAVDDRCEPVLQVPDKTASEPISDRTRPEEEFAMALGSLLHGRKSRLRARKLPPQLRLRFEALRATESSTEATARTAPATSRSTAASHGPNRRSEATDIRVSRSTAIS